MGFLDAKERILDIVLTDRGRELLSQNSLKIKYFAFSDEFVDYSGSLASYPNISGSTFDDYVHSRTNMIEADRRKTGDLSCFLYTVAQTEKTLVLTDLRVSVTGTIVLERRYFSKPIAQALEEDANTDKDDTQLVFRIERDKISENERKNRYVSTQFLERLENDKFQVTDNVLKVVYNPMSKK